MKYIEVIYGKSWSLTITGLEITVISFALGEWEGNRCVEKRGERGQEGEKKKGRGRGGGERDEDRGLKELRRGE